MSKRIKCMVVTELQTVEITFTILTVYRQK